jgi:hypothetical protein
MRLTAERLHAVTEIQTNLNEALREKKKKKI